MAYTEKQKEYTMKYLEKLKEIRFRVKPEEYARYEEAAKMAGYPSMRQFYMEAIEEKVKQIIDQCANFLDIQRTICYYIIVRRKRLTITGQAEKGGYMKENMTDKQLEVILNLVADKFESCKDMEEVKKAIEDVRKMAKKEKAE